MRSRSKFLNTSEERIYCFAVNVFSSNDNLMEILLIVDALRRSSAGRITAAIPILVMQDKTDVFVLPGFQSVLRLLQICLSLRRKQNLNYGFTLRSNPRVFRYSC